MKQESTTIDRIQCAQIDWAETPQKQSNTQWQDMQPEITCIETHNQVACITSMKICSDLNHFKIKWKILQKIVENNKAKIPWDFSIHKQVLANQPDIVARIRNQYSRQKSLLAIDIAIPSDRYDRKKEYERKKSQRNTKG